MGAAVWWRRIMGREVRQELPPPQEVVLPGAGQTRVAQSVDCLGASCPRPQLLAMKVMVCRLHGAKVLVAPLPAIAAELSVVLPNVTSQWPLTGPGTVMPGSTSWASAW